MECEEKKRIMEFPGEIISNIIEQRLNLFKNVMDENSKICTVSKINHLMNFGIKIGIEFLLKNKNCKNDLHQIPFEMWNLKRNKIKVSFFLNNNFITKKLKLLNLIILFLNEFVCFFDFRVLNQQKNFLRC